MRAIINEVRVMRGEGDEAPPGEVPSMSPFRAASGADPAAASACAYNALFLSPPRLFAGFLPFLELGFFAILRCIIVTAPTIPPFSRATATGGIPDKRHRDRRDELHGLLIVLPRVDVCEWLVCAVFMASGL